MYADTEEIKKKSWFIKSLVRQYGAVYVAYDHFDGGFNSATDAYNNPNCEISSGTECANGVVIIGWDDSYSKSKFGECKPANDGAFIVKVNRLVDSNPNSIDSEPRILGRMITSTDGMGNTTEYTYNGLDQILKKKVFFYIDNSGKMNYTEYI